MSKFNDEADDYDLTFQTQTDKAWCFRDDNGEDHWLPKSQCDANERGEMVRGRVYTVTVPNWVAEEKGLL